MQELDAKQDVVSRVTDGGYCIGCGGCAHVAKNIDMQVNQYGQLIPVKVDGQVTPEENQHIAKVCPFNSDGDHEDEIAQQYYPELPSHPRIGRFDKVYAGRVNDESFYQKASSGGIGKWLLTELLKQGEVDYVVQVTETENQNQRGLSYYYQVFDNPSDVITGSKSAYYPIELSQVLEFIKQNPGRYAITGVPCYVKTIRRLCSQDSELNERVKYTLGVVCGHLKTKAYAELIGWQLGVPPEELATLDFREKLQGRKANQKGVRATRIDGSKSEAEIVQNLFGTNYAHGLFKFSACDYCDDVLAETADVAVGDAWLPQYLEKGTSLVITRNKHIGEILEKAKQNELHLESLTSDQAAKSQAAGLRHRREYLQYRLLQKQQVGQWVPEKRVVAGDAHLTNKQKRIVELRTEISAKSHDLFVEAKKQKDVGLVKRSLMPLIEEMHDLRLTGWKFVATRSLRSLGIYNALAKIKKRIKPD